jgi:hypothetical protein
MQGKGVTNQAADWLTQRNELYVEELVGTAAVAPYLESLVTCVLGHRHSLSAFIFTEDPNWKL